MQQNPIDALGAAIVSAATPSTPHTASQQNADAKFNHWLDANQAIWNEFCCLADKMRNSGRKHWSARAVLHVLRWERALRDTTDPLFKINNNWSARMARKYNAAREVEFFVERERHP